MMKRRIRLFVYGTLQPHAGMAMATWLAGRTVRSEPGSVPGLLRAILDAKGAYPALLPGKGHGRVQGIVCELQLSAGDLARLDRYEGREYRRTALPVMTRTGRVTAQAYLWRTKVPANAAKIGSGDFLEWLSATCRTPFPTGNTTR